MRRFITLTLCVLALGACATANNNATQPITCTAGSDCDEKWSRAMQWLEKNTSAKVTVTDTQLSAAEAAPTPAFEVTKATSDEGKSYTISMRAWCAAGNCDDMIGRARTGFYDYVLGR